MIAAAVRRLTRTAILAFLVSAPALAQHIDAAAPVSIEIKEPTPTLLVSLGALHPSPENMLTSVAALLDADKPIHIKLSASAEHTAIAIDDQGVPTIAIPVEDEPLQTSETMAREMTHAVRMSMGAMSGGSERTVGATVLAEGLAMRVARKLFPGQPETDFVEARWFADAQAERGRILLNVRSVLNDKDGATVTKFTTGTGPAGVEREAYYVAWLVTGYWLSHGETYAEIAHVKDLDAPTRVAEAIDKLLLEGRR